MGNRRSAVETDKPEVTHLRAVAASDAGVAPSGMLDDAEAAVKPEGEDGPAQPPVTVPAPALPPQAAGIPSEHQDHALNLMSDTIQPQLDRFKSWSENISTEINARSAKFEAEQTEREVQFEANQNRLAEEHDKEIEGFRKLQENVGIGFKVLTDAVATYTELAKPVGRNLRDATTNEDEDQ